MDVTTILANDEEDVRNVRVALIHVRQTLKTAAHDYARAALKSADTTLKMVQDAMPCGVVWPHMVDYQTNTQKAASTFDALSRATGMLLVAEETGDDSIDNLNAKAKLGSVDGDVFASMIEGANQRMALAKRGIPVNGAPGQRCNPDAIATGPPPPPTKPMEDS